MNKFKIAVDIDDVLCAFTPHAHKFFGHELEVCDYWCPITMNGKFGEGWFTEKIEPCKEFWDTLPALSRPEDIDFDFECYISAFPYPMYESRVEWLKKHGFPDKPLICTFNKLEYCTDNGIGCIIDDKPETIRLFNTFATLGIHFITPYAGFPPEKNYITNLNQVKDILELKNRYETA